MADTLKYTVGWICALPTEAVAAATFLDDEHDDVPEVALHDNNSYTLGSIGGHNVVIAVLPDGEYGLVSAATVARDMLHSFPNIRISVMVGIGGGAPSPDHDIRLGDVVVSSRGGGKGGVVQYDFGKAVQGLPFEHTDFLDQPPAALRTAVSALKGQHERKGHQLHRHVESKLAENPRLRQKYSRPTLDTDILYRADFVHPNPSEMCGSACRDEPGAHVSRAERVEGADEPLIHYGLIASGNQLIKDAAMRDRLASQMDVLCFEMEAAGFMNHWPCLVIRGICDYSDSHKNKQWQGFAAMMAAAYAKDLPRRILPKRVEAEDRIKNTLEKFQSVITQTSQTVEETDRVVSAMRRDELLASLKKWLLPADLSVNLTAAKAKRHRGTGVWFLEGDKFRQWETGCLPNLWLYGLSGCGKTILSAAILHHLQEKANCPVVSFFFDFNDGTKQDLESLLRTLAYQLCLKGPDAIKELESLFKAHEEGRSGPSINTLEAYIRSTVLAYGRVIIVMDALDECTTRQSVLEWIERTVSCLGSNIQFLVTGRPEADLKWGLNSVFGHNGCMQLDGQAIDANISSFISSQLESCPRFVRKNLSLDLKEQIRQKLGSEAHGMFRWASCQLDTLAECLNPFAIKKALTQLPRTLDETYQRMMDKITQEHKSDAARLLQFLVHAKRPLNTGEVMDILSIQTEGEQWSFNSECKPFFEECITQYCPGFVAITEKEVRLAHFSVKEFLVQQSHFSPLMSTIAITRHCLTYLIDVGAEEKHPLGYHATKLWMEYAISAGSDQTLLQDILRFLSNEAAFRRWFKSYETWMHREFGTLNSSEGSEGSQLYATCFGGLLWVSRVLLNDGADVNARGGVYDNALQAASYGGHLETVQFLLDNGAEIFEFSGRSGSALQAASRQGHHEIVRILLERGANPDSQSLFSANPIYTASHRNHLQVVQLLLKHGANVNGQDDFGCTALHGACLEGNQDIAQLLLDNGADHAIQTDLQTWRIGFDKIAAAYTDTQQLEVQFWELQLVEPFTSVEAFIDSMRRALQYLFVRNELGNLENSKSGTALQAAAAKGHLKTLSLLLQRGANPNAEGGYHGSPIQAAISGNHWRTLCCLLKRGADPNKRDHKYGNVLQAAASLGNTLIVQCLLIKGAKINAQGGKYGTALQAASANGFRTTVQLLLEKGANRELQGGKFGTALDAALSKGHQGIVRLLQKNLTESVDDQEIWKRIEDDQDIRICSTMAYNELRS